MADDTARDNAIYQALKAADEVAAAVQAHLVEEHGGDPEPAEGRPGSDSIRLLRQARERIGQGLRTVDDGSLSDADRISMRKP